MLSKTSLLSAALTVLALSASASAADFRTGTYVSGAYKPNVEHIRFLAVEFEGSFSRSRVESVFLSNLNTLLSQKKTMAKPGGWKTVRLPEGRRSLVVGWYDDERGEYGWIAVENLTQSFITMSSSSPAQPMADMSMYIKRFDVDGNKVTLTFNNPPNKGNVNENDIQYFVALQ